MLGDRKMNGNNNIVVFDLETTGTSPVKNTIIEIGAVKVSNGVIIDEFNELVNPRICIPSHITKITGITDEMVCDKKDITSVLPRFIEFCDTDYIMGHNIAFDYSFIKSSCLQNGLRFEKKAYDTLSIARKVLYSLKSKSLASVCQHYSVIQNNAHRAFEDARVTYEIFSMMYKEYYDQYPDAFIAKQMSWKPKKQSPITSKQKSFLSSLVKRYNVLLEKPIETLSKSEASRYIDNILTEYGKKFG